MSEVRKQSGALLWAIVAVVVAPVCYVLSSGPAICIAERINNDLFNTCCKWVYAPIAWLSLNGPEPLHDLIGWWVELWMP